MYVTGVSEEVRFEILLQRQTWKELAKRSQTNNIHSYTLINCLNISFQRGCPPSLRGSIWGQVLGSQVVFSNCKKQVIIAFFMKGVGERQCLLQ